LRSVTYGSGRFVAVGLQGAAVASPDGITWTATTIPNFGLATGVTYGDGTFVAVGFGGAVATSADGLAWTRRSSGTDSRLWQVTHGNGLFVAVGFDNGVIVTSPDGTTWTSRASGVTDSITGCAFNDGRFVAVAGDTILTSSDGIHWSPNPGSLELNPQSLGSGVMAGDGQFLAWGRNLATSPDGINWTERVTGVQLEFNELTFASGLFVGVGSAIRTSPDGSEWTTQTSGIPESYILDGVSFGQGQFVAVGSVGLLLTSSNGVNWVRRNSGTTFNFVSVAHGGGQFVAVGNNDVMSQHTIVTSTNGSNWTARLTTSGALSRIAYGNGMFAALGENGAIRTSTNGINWTSRASGTTGGLVDVAFGNNRFVAVGESGNGDAISVTSPDGITWALGTMVTGQAGSVYSVTYGSGVFAALQIRSGGYSILSSVDGTHWTRNSSIISEPAVGIGYFNNRFIAYGGSILTCDAHPRLGRVSLLPDGTSQIPVTGISGLTYSLEASTNLTDWSAVTNALLPNGNGTLTDSSGTNCDRRFYRAASQP
jgi:hypothetical protein